MKDDMSTRGIREMKNPRRREIVIQSFLDGITAAGLFGWLRRPGAPTELIDSRNPEGYESSEEFQDAVRRYRHDPEFSRDERRRPRAERVLFEFGSLANPTPLELEQLDLRRILRDVFDPVHGGCPVEMSLPSPLPVLADAAKLGNALREIREIRKNALEAMSDITDRPNLIKVKVRVDEDAMTKKYVQIEITDNGPGIPDVVKENIFKPGVTTKADNKDLGLSMVKSVIDRHGGTIETGNSPDGGTRYIVRIPSYQPAEDRAHSVPD